MQIEKFELEFFNVITILHSTSFYDCRIEIAGCVTCFLDFNQTFGVNQRLIDFQTNIVLCDIQSYAKLNAEHVQIKVLSKCTLFNVECALIRFQDFKCSVQKRSGEIGDSDQTKSSEVFFYALTSGSCGAVKPIGVTYKCFWPNIISFGWVTFGESWQMSNLSHYLHSTNSIQIIVVINILSQNFAYFIALIGNCMM